MILLTSTSDKIQIISGSAVTVDVHASWVDNASGTITPGRTNTAISTAATIDVVASPGASTQRNLQTLCVRNKHASNSNTLTVQHTDGTTVAELFKCVLAAGEVLTFIDSIGWDVFGSDGSHKASASRVLFKAITADETAQSAATAQPWFPTAGGVSVLAATSYFMEGLLQLSNGTTTHTTGILFAGTATLTSIMYETNVSSAAAAVMVAPTHNIASVATSIITNATSGAVEFRCHLSGIIRINGAGTLIPQFIWSANPTGTNLVKRNTFFRMWAIGDNSVASMGTWA